MSAQEECSWQVKFPNVQEAMAWRIKDDASLPSNKFAEEYALIFATDNMIDALKLIMECHTKLSLHHNRREVWRN